jgi:hypothetical protein
MFHLTYAYIVPLNDLQTTKKVYQHLRLNFVQRIEKISTKSLFTVFEVRVTFLAAEVVTRFGLSLIPSKSS